MLGKSFTGSNDFDGAAPPITALPIATQKRLGEEKEGRIGPG